MDFTFFFFFLNTTICFAPMVNTVQTPLMLSVEIICIYFGFNYRVVSSDCLTRLFLNVADLIIE